MSSKVSRAPYWSLLGISCGRKANDYTIPVHAYNLIRLYFGEPHTRGMVTEGHLLNSAQFRAPQLNRVGGFYYPPEVSSMKYCCWGVFRKEYFRLFTKQCK